MTVQWYIKMHSSKQHAMPSHELQRSLVWNFRKCIILGKLYQFCHWTINTALETVCNICFLWTILELCSEIAVSRKLLGIGQCTHTLFLSNDWHYDPQNIDLQYWDIQFINFFKNNYMATLLLISTIWNRTMFMQNHKLCCGMANQMFVNRESFCNKACNFGSEI
jgi:hypothetical protein